jgi:hypothetical protein
VTPEAQRIAIAEACGWTNVAPRIVKNVKHQGDDITVGIWSDDGWIPDYLNDLNVMHEVEKVLTYAQGGDMTLWIQRMTCAGYGPQLFATAAQRAEAFLRTIGKWEESR